jgi:hypothetical protein
MWTLICHTYNKRLVMLYFKILVFKSWTVNRFAASSIMIDKVTSLSHESFHNSMKNRTLISKTFFMCCKLSKILACLWCYLIKELYFYSPDFLSIDRNLKEDVRFGRCITHISSLLSIIKGYFQNYKIKGEVCIFPLIPI